MALKRPKVIINYACSLDGKIAFPDKSRARLSSEEDKRRVHLLRSKVDAILVGVGTILADDPSLLVKDKYVRNPKQPLRIILDSRCRTPRTAKCLGPGARTLIVTSGRCDRGVAGAEILRCGEGEVDLPLLLDYLWKKGIRSLLVEGGGTVLWSFISQRFFDEIYVYIAPIEIGGSRSPTGADGPGFERIEECARVRFVSARKFPGGGVLVHVKRDR
jgi:2,5-diamino-6-(ribosylamino)-4(3H)-pyrimidinone 5'-phosphate reductase